MARLAKALAVLRDQVNVLYPNRSHASDGWIGDPAHASRKSDHNPNSVGVVTALDLTTDAADGADTETLAEILRASRDHRIKYVIYRGRMFASYDAASSAWTWRPYNGPNGHFHHMHISVESGAAFYDDDRPWALDAVRSEPGGERVLRKGDKGIDVEEVQRALRHAGATLLVDGDFGAATERTVRGFQSTRGLTADGVVGPKTWAALRGLAG